MKLFKNSKSILSATLAVFIALTALSGCVKKQETDRSEDAIYTENYSVTAGMMEYYFNSQYISFLNSYSGYLDKIGLDTSKPLSEQKCSLDASVSTWYDYFMNAAKEKLSQCLIVFEDAKKNGKELTSSEKSEAKEVLTQLGVAAKEKGISKKQYLSTNYGKNVTEDDVLKCAELERLTARYYSDYIKTLDTGDAALEKYLSGKKKTYCTVNYIYFQVPAADISDSAMETARKTAQQLSAQKTPEKLIEEIGAYAENYYADNSSLKGKKLKTKVEEIKKNCVITDVSYSQTEAMGWAFSEERKVGDSTVIKNEQSASYDIYYLTSLPARKSYNAVNIRQIQFNVSDYGDSASAKKAAEECLKTLKESGFSKESFESAASSLSGDESTKDNGGLLENLHKGSLLKADEIEKWIFDDGRKQGDVSLIKTDQYGWHIVYIESFGEPVWKTEVRRDLEASRFNSYISELGDNIMIYENNNLIFSTEETDQSENYPTAASDDSDSTVSTTSSAVTNS